MEGFVAFPDGHRLVIDAVSEAVGRSAGKAIHLTPWPKMNILGFKLDDLIRESISNADVLVADITFPNANVFYEIGYAIAAQKPILPIVNTAVEHSVARIQKLGLFDTIGWAAYNNGEELSENVDNWEALAWTGKYVKKRDYQQPLFILDTLKKTDFRNHIIHAVENSHVEYRAFDPAEIPRLTAAQAISEVSASAGVILPFLADEIVDSSTHNLRASFILGLCHGYSLEALALQYEHLPAPVDYRDFISNSTHRTETENKVEGYCAETLIKNQTASARDSKIAPGILGQIDLGSPAAENEPQQLNYYFVETAEFARALRAEGAVVIGRKGSGKSAIYLQIAQRSVRDRNTCVVDLRPASHNLSEMREQLLSVATAGVFDHTIAAFWQYILYIEVVLKIRELVLPKAKNNFALQERVRKVESDFGLSESVVSGDFTSRLQTAVADVVKLTRDVKSAEELRRQLTNAMFENPIPKLRDAVVGFKDHFDSFRILIDDLDKGWPPRRVEPHDVLTIRHLIEVLNKMQNDLGRKGVAFKHLIFLRSDIYERLVEQTSDRGKYNIIKVDWSDPEQLRNLLKQRVVSNLDPDRQEQAWNAINPMMAVGGDAVDLMIEHSLRRPRFLIDLGERTLSFAINRGHGSVTEADVREGLRQMSLYLVSDFGYEMRDVAGTPEDIFYLFIGTENILKQEDVIQILSVDKLGIGVNETIELLLWYGFLGVVSPKGETVFIYDREYDFRRLEAERASSGGMVAYQVNPAFLMGLDRN